MKPAGGLALPAPWRYQLATMLLPPEARDLAVESISEDDLRGLVRLLANDVDAGIRKSIEQGVDTFPDDAVHRHFEVGPPTVWTGRVLRPGKRFLLQRIGLVRAGTVAGAEHFVVDRFAADGLDDVAEKPRRCSEWFREGVGTAVGCEQTPCRQPAGRPCRADRHRACGGRSRWQRLKLARRRAVPPARTARRWAAGLEAQGRPLSDGAVTAAAPWKCESAARRHRSRRFRYRARSGSAAGWSRGWSPDSGVNSTLLVVTELTFAGCMAPAISTTTRSFLRTCG